MSLLVLVIGATSVAACGSDDPSTPGNGTGTTGAKTTRVTAAAGGTVSDPGGKLTLNIPPGALATDTDITLAVQPSSNGSAGEVYEFGPDGLTFTQPVALSISGTGITVPEGKSLSVALLEGETFKPVAGSTFDGSKATASITHFSKYTLVIIDGQVVIKAPETCAEAYATFVPCGGDLTGKWTFGEFCTEVPAPSGGGGSCPGIVAEGEIDFKRDATFAGTTLTLSEGTITLKGTVTYPRSCFENATCAQIQEGLNNGKPGGTCVDKGTDACTCTSPPQTSTQPAETQTYSVSGNSITTTKADGKTSTSEYCVKGDVAISREPDKDGKKGSLFTLTRKK